MPGRKKRALKGIESTRAQIEEHRKKLESAVRSGNIGLTKYYEKELESFENAIARKRVALRKR
jgi:hypothetical protein